MLEKKDWCSYMIESYSQVEVFPVKIRLLELARFVSTPNIKWNMGNFQYYVNNTRVLWVINYVVLPWFMVFSWGGFKSKFE